MLNTSLSRFQRRALMLFSTSIILTSVLTLILHPWLRYHAAPRPLLFWLLAPIPALPFLGTLLIALRYLAREQDEYIRTLVLSALLHGALLTLALNVLYGCFEDAFHVAAPPFMTFVDLFLITSMASLSLKLRGSQ